MKITYNWLKQFLDINLEPLSVSHLLTDLGLEVEGTETLETIKGGLEGVVVAEVLTCEKHPNADRLKLTTVNIGNNQPLQIICGAPNVTVGQKVPVATVGTTLYDKSNEPFKIKKGKIRGQQSYGMICAEDELGLGKNHEGILVLDNNLTAGTPLAEVFKVEKDTIFEIGLTPNRSDAMSHYGVARDLRAGLMQQGQNLPLTSPSVSDFHVVERTFKIDVAVVDRTFAPRYCGITITDITVKESPKWIQNRLKAIGINPKNNIVDITNYVLHELGQPLHAFDASMIEQNKVVVKTLSEGTKFTTLDGVERTLSAQDIMICDAKDNPLCIAGVFGGIHSGVTTNTKSIFLESAYFNPVAIRKTAKRHNLNTDASFRFERGIDINFIAYSLKRAALLIKQYAGGTICSTITDFYPERVEDFQVFLSYENTQRLIGQEIPKETIKNILASLGIRIHSETEAGLGLTIPSYRTDVQREADIIEEILRIYGYNNIVFPRKLNASTSFDKNPLTTENNIADLLTALGFFETITNSLSKASYTELYKDVTTTAVEILNPLSNDLKTLRNNMLFSGLESIAYNINRKNTALKLFEFGKTYHRYDKKYQENKQLSLWVTGDKTKANWKTNSQPSDFFYIKGVVMALFSKLGLSGLATNPMKSEVFSEGITLSANQKTLVEIGVVKSEILEVFGIKQPVFFANFNWENTLKSVNQVTIKMVELPKFPAVKRDLSLLLDKEITFETVYHLAFQSEKKVLKAVDLFDVYQGEELPEGKKSYAVNFVLQDKHKTLTDKQIDKIMQKLQDAFVKQLQAVLR